MLNQIIFVGRLVRDIEIVTSENGARSADITLAVPRSYKNEEGQYDTDFITCKLTNSIADNTAEYCKKGDLLGVKGRVECLDSTMSMLVEKVTYPSSKSN